MPNLVKCPQCSGAVLVPAVDDPQLSISCPLCAGMFLIGELTDTGIPLAVAMPKAPASTAASSTSPPQPLSDDVIGGQATTANVGEWTYPGFGMIVAATASTSATGTPHVAFDEVVKAFDQPVSAGQASMAAGSGWSYPGCAGWPTQAWRVTRSVMVPVVASWRYPGMSDWPQIVVETALDEADGEYNEVYAASSTELPEPAWNDAAQSQWSTEAESAEAAEGDMIGIAPEPERPAYQDFTNRATAAASARSSSSFRTSSKRKKSKELNPLILGVGVVGGGVIGLGMGYCILYVIMVMIMGRPGTFTTFWQ